MHGNNPEQGVLEQLKTALLTGSGLSSKGQALLRQNCPSDGDFAVFVHQVDEAVLGEFIQLHHAGHSDGVVVNYDNLMIASIECKHANKALPATAHENEGLSARLQKGFRLIELASRSLPSGMQRAFEPAYFDLKKEFLLNRRQCKEKKERGRLCFFFGIYVALAVVGCAWEVCCDKLKRAILSL